MRNLVLGLAAVLWAQTSTAWKWYGYTQENSPDRHTYPVSTLWSSQKGVVRYLSDTIYVMGTYWGEHNTSMELPDTVGSSINPTISGAGDDVRTYLAAYDRHTGAILWWMYFYHRSHRSDNTWGQDMAVASDGTVYLLLIGHPNGLYWEFKDRNGGASSGSWNQTVLSGARASHLLKIQPYQSNPIVARSSIGLSGSVEGIIISTCDLKHLLLVGDTLLFASGEFRTLVASNLNAVSSTSSTLFTITSPVGNIRNRGLLVRWNLADPNLSNPKAAQLRYGSFLSGNADVTGHRLAYDPVSNRIRWLVEMEDLGQRRLIYALSTPFGNNYSTTINGPTDVTEYTLRVLSINMDLSLPSTPYYHNLSRTDAIPVPESPYLFSYNDTLVWSRSMWYTSALIDGGSFTTIDGTFGYDHALLVEQILSGGGNDAQLSRHVQIPQAIDLHLSGMAVEREGELVYLSGAADGESWGPENALPLGLQPNSRSGFLMGLRRTPSSYRIVGYRRFF